MTLSRRTLLQVPALALTFGGAFTARAGARPRALLTLWLDGGPSQLETWDPHPGLSSAPPLATRSQGLLLSGLYPQLAEQAQHLSVVRSLVSKEGDHERGTYALKTGHRPEAGVQHPSLGALAARSTPPGFPLPPHLSLGASPWPARGGLLGPAFDAFRVANPGSQLDNLAPRVEAPARQGRRFELLRTVAQQFTAEHPGAEPRLRHQANLEAARTMMTAAELAAFRLDDESARVRATYGDTAFGRGCLVARRLLERGACAVEVSLSGFDSHTGNHEAHRAAAATLDPAFATLLRELSERELLQHTTVLCVGEFGRTPKLNAAAGRDHWPHAFSALLAGAGIRAGQVVGETDPSGEKREPTQAVGVEDLAATVLTALGLDCEEQLESAEGRPVALSTGKPVKQVLE
jgi:hypothetical protein